MTRDSQRHFHRLVFAALSAAAGVALFHFYGNASRGYIPTNSLFVWWGTQWLDPASETEHGWLILAASAWLFWRNLRQQTFSAAPSARGFFSRERWNSMFMVALVLHGMGFFLQQTRLSILGLLVFVLAVIGQAGGIRWARAAMFPVAFLAFAIPVNFLDSVGFWLRMTIVRSASVLADLCGWPVLVQGSRLVSPDGLFHYEVDYACAGVRSLVAILALSLVLGYVRLRPVWSRVAMVAVALPLTYFANVVRLLAIIGTGHLCGQKAGGLVHDVGGYVVFVGVLGLVHLVAGFFERREEVRDSSSVNTAESAEFAGGAVDGKVAAIRWWHICLVPVGGSLALMAALAVGEKYLPEPKADIILSADQFSPVDLPAFPAGDWIGRRAEVSAVERQILPPDTGFSRRIYMSPVAPAQPVLISIVLSGRDRSSIHRPEICLVGQGWSIRGEREHRFVYPERSGVAFPSTVLQLEHRATPGAATEPQLAAYWFVGGGRVVRTHWARIGWDIWARLRGRPIRWAYVIVMTSAPRGEAEALARMQAVLNAVLPSFQPPL